MGFAVLSWEAYFFECIQKLHLLGGEFVYKTVVKTTRLKIKEVLGN